MKAGHCLLLLRGCLQGFVGREVLAFHRSLLAAAPGLGPLATCRSGSRCSPRARQVSTRPGVLTVAPHRPRAQCLVPSPEPGRPSCLGFRCPDAAPPSRAPPHRRPL